MNALATLIVLTLAACSHYQGQDPAQWQGQSVEVLYEAWGQPVSSQQITGDEMIITYTQSQEEMVPSPQIAGDPIPTQGDFFEQEDVNFCTTTFTVINDIVTEYETEGTNCS